MLFFIQHVLLVLVSMLTLKKLLTNKNSLCSFGLKYIYLRYINSYLRVGMLADMLSHFSGASNALQGADPGAGGEVSNSSNQVLYDQGTVQKCYMLLKIK